MEAPAVVAMSLLPLNELVPLTDLCRLNELFARSDLPS